LVVDWLLMLLAVLNTLGLFTQSDFVHVVVYFIVNACLLLLFDLVYQYQANRLAEKNISEMVYFVSGGT